MNMDEQHSSLFSKPTQNEDVFLQEQLFLPLGLCLSLFHVSQPEVGNSLGSTTPPSQGLPFFHLNVILLDLERLFDLWEVVRAKMDLSRVKRQRGAPTEKGLWTEERKSGSPFQFGCLQPGV